jgi:phosphinothricin acetyltransferase
MDDACAAGLRIRPARQEDVAAMLRIYAHYVRETAVTFEYDVPGQEEFAGRVARVQQAFPWLVAEKGGAVTGYAYAAPFHPRAAYAWCAELAIYMARDARGIGLGAALYSALGRVLRLQNMLLAYACVAWNGQEDDRLTHASRRFHERQGFRVTGYFPGCGYKFGRWYGMLWMEKRLAPPASPPAAVIPFAQLDAQDLQQALRCPPPAMA